MVLFDAEGKIAKYNTALDILKEFCRLRHTSVGQTQVHRMGRPEGQAVETTDVPWRAL